MFIRGPCLQSSARSSVPRCLGLASKSQPRGPALGCFKGHAVRTYPDLHTENAILLSKSSEVLNETSSSHAEPSKDRVQRKHGPRDGQSLKQQIASFMGFVGMARSPQQPSQEQAHEGLPAGLSGSDADEFNLMSAEEAGDSPQHQDSNGHAHFSISAQRCTQFRAHDSKCCLQPVCVCVVVQGPLKMMPTIVSKPPGN
eukprot:1159463-Pelagomonas_calceolata.AAC.3